VDFKLYSLSLIVKGATLLIIILISLLGQPTITKQLSFFFFKDNSEIL